jgi:hypothetical protein
LLTKKSFSASRRLTIAAWPTIFFKPRISEGSGKIAIAHA